MNVCDLNYQHIWVLEPGESEVYMKLIYRWSLKAWIGGAYENLIDLRFHFDSISKYVARVKVRLKGVHLSRKSNSFKLKAGRALNLAQNTLNQFSRLTFYRVILIPPILVSQAPNSNILHSPHLLFLGIAARHQRVDSKKQRDKHCLLVSLMICYRWFSWCADLRSSWIVCRPRSLTDFGRWQRFTSAIRFC